MMEGCSQMMGQLILEQRQLAISKGLPNLYLGTDVPPSDTREIGFCVTIQPDYFGTRAGRQEFMRDILAIIGTLRHMFPDTAQLVVKHSVGTRDPPQMSIRFKDVTKEFAQRRLTCRAATLCMLGLPLKLHFGLTKDVATLLAQALWHTRQHEEWEA
jgi:hypothetical protein